MNKRTKTYLIIAGLLSLTGAVYAATPFFFTPFSQATGVAASPSNLYATEWCDQNFYGVRLHGECARCWRRFRLGISNALKNTWLLLQGSPSRAGFTPTRRFHHRRPVYLEVRFFVREPSTPVPFAQVGCPFSDHSSLTFDKVGTFGYKMIVACENGPIWTVDGFQ